MTSVPTTRRRVLRGAGLLAGATALGIATTGTAAATGEPNFAPAIYADGETWGTKGVARLPAPTEDTLQSYDKLFAVVNSNNPAGQLPVGEAAPGNPDFNGGRWFTHTVEWTQQGFDDHGTVPVLTRYGPAGDPEAVLTHLALGHLAITPGSPDPSATPDYFECPLLPDKS